jgi:hypothetical protein
MSTSGLIAPGRREIGKKRARPDVWEVRVLLREQKFQKDPMDDATLAPDLEAPSPSLPAVAPHRALDAALIEKARDYARRARSENTGRAYRADWRAYAAWCRKRGLFEPSPEPQLIGLYRCARRSGWPSQSRDDRGDYGNALPVPLLFKRTHALIYVGQLDHAGVSVEHLGQVGRLCGCQEAVRDGLQKPLARLGQVRQAGDRRQPERRRPAPPNRAHAIHDQLQGG